MLENNDTDYIFEEIESYLNIRYSFSKDKIQSLIDSSGLKTIAEKLPMNFSSRSPKFWGEWLIRKR